MEHLAKENKVCGVGVLYIKSDRVRLRPVASLSTSFPRLSEAGTKDSAKILLALLPFLDFLAYFFGSRKQIFVSSEKSCTESL